MKIEIPSFSGNLDIEIFLDWVYEVKKFFDVAYVPEEKHIKFIAYKIKRGADAWWNQLEVTRRRQGKSSVMTWRRMKQLLQGRFLSPDYQQILYNQFEQYRQDTRTATTYTEEFYRLSSRGDLSMTDEHQTAKYIIMLKYPIQDRVILHDVFSVDEAHNKTIKIERLKSKALPFKSVAEKTSSSIRT